MRLNMALVAADSATAIVATMAKIWGKKIFNICYLVHILLFYAVKFSKTLEFWTSGANEGEYCDTEKVYSWCSMEKRVRRQEISANWMDATKEPTASERCLSLQLKDAKYGLGFSNCGSKHSIICEVGQFIPGKAKLLVLIKMPTAKMQQCHLSINLQSRCKII